MQSKIHVFSNLPKYCLSYKFANKMFWLSHNTGLKNMRTRRFVLLIGLLSCLGSVEANAYQSWKIPEGISIGLATAATQIEGAWNVDGKGENIWDYFTHHYPERIKDRSNADVACDSYHKFKEDIKILKQLGVNHYRFSLSWSRVLPTGDPKNVNQLGIKYYHKILDELEKNGIEPYVTIYHFDHPQIFEEFGSWTNEKIVDFFVDYARVVFREFGDRVKMFSTINEPNILCTLGYGRGIFAPGIKGKRSEYLCSHNLIKAHARAYHIYNNEFRSKQKGKVGIVLNCFYFYSKDKNDTISDEIAFQFNCGHFAHPIYSKTGDYPEIMKNMVAENSKYRGLSESRLPKFSDEWIHRIKGAFDYLGLNYYTSFLVEPIPPSANALYVNDTGLNYTSDPSWKGETITKLVPLGFRDLLIKIKKEYGDVPVYITENGYGDKSNTLEDDNRIEYIKGHMKAMLEAIQKHSCNVKAYTGWSLMDNFEWASGYTVKFGLVHVDFDNSNRTRKLKKSANWFSNVIKTREL